VKVRLRVPIVALLVAALALYLFAQWQQRQATEDRTIIQAAHNALSAGKAYRVRQDSLRKRAERAVVTVRVRDTVIIRLDARLARDTSARDSVQTLLLKADTLTAQRDSLRTAVRLLTVRAERAELRVADLERHLATTLTVAECRLLGARWLPRCPSRTVAFVVGVTATTAVVVVAQ